MSILKFEPRTHRTLSDMICYLTNPTKTDERGIFGIGLNPRCACIEMEYIQRLYNRDNLSNPYMQIILAFDEGMIWGLPILVEVCYKIGKCLVLDERQVLGAVHFKNPTKLHCHYLLNYVGVHGNLYRQEISLLWYKKIANKILAEYGFPKILCYDTS